MKEEELLIHQTYCQLLISEQAKTKSITDKLADINILSCNGMIFNDSTRIIKNYYFMKNQFYNAYELLDIEPNSTADQIKKAYKKKSMEFHPDKHDGSKPANAMFQIITRCKDILLDPETRSQHDYALGFKVKPTPQPERVVINKTEKETDWGAVVGVGLAGLLIGMFLGGDSK